MRKPLEGLRVAILAADGFEQVEVTVPRRALRSAGADVRVISLRPGRIRGVNFVWRGRKVAVDDTVFDARPEDYGALLLPGGFVNPDLLRQSERALDFVRRMDELGRPIATLCHGPEVLVSAGLAKGRRLTSWPGIAVDLRNAGAEWTDAPLVRDGRWVSSRGPHDLAQFIPAMIGLFDGEGARNLPEVPRRWFWAAQLSRLATFGAPALIAFAIGARLRQRWITRTRNRAAVAAGVVGALVAASRIPNAIAARALVRRGEELSRRRVPATDGGGRATFPVEPRETFVPTRPQPSP